MEYIESEPLESEDVCAHDASMCNREDMKVKHIKLEPLESEDVSTHTEHVKSEPLKIEDLSTHVERIKSEPVESEDVCEHVATICNCQDEKVQHVKSEPLETEGASTQDATVCNCEDEKVEQAVKAEALDAEGVSMHNADIGKDGAEKRFKEEERDLGEQDDINNAEVVSQQSELPEHCLRTFDHCAEEHYKARDRICRICASRALSSKEELYGKKPRLCSEYEQEIARFFDLEVSLDSDAYSKVLCVKCVQRIKDMKKSLTPTKKNLAKAQHEKTQSLWCVYSERLSTNQCTLCAHWKVLMRGGRPKDMRRWRFKSGASSRKIAEDDSVMSCTDDS